MSGASASPFSGVMTAMDDFDVCNNNFHTVSLSFGADEVRHQILPELILKQLYKVRVKICQEYSVKKNILLDALVWLFFLVDCVRV